MKKIAPLIGILMALVAGSASATYFTAEYVSAGGYVAPSTPPKGAAPTGVTLAPGLYTSVITGAIVVSNPGGALNVTAGQFGYTPSGNVTPVVIPTNPGLQFTPPPVFTSSTPLSSASTASGKSNVVDCEVR